MALIKCPECGREISDKAVSCPRCGCPASEFPKNKTVQESRNVQSNEDMRYRMGGYQLVKDTVTVESQEDLERIADEVYAECPNDQYKGITIFRERTKTDLATARDIMFMRYHGATSKELDFHKKMFKYEKKKRAFSDSKCPKCGSKHIDSYCRQGVSLTSESSLFGGTLITHHGNIDQGLKCMYCGYTWNPYKKK